MDVAWLEGLKILLQIENIFMSIIGTILGIVLGAIPGLGPGIGVALLIVVTFGMSPATGLILLGGVYAGSVYGGSISAILFNAPGTAASTATALDGYELTKQGRSGEALGIATMASVIGGMFGVASLVFFSPYIANFSLKFGPAEYFMLAIMGLSIIAMASKGAMRKGLISGGLGLMISFIGFSTLTAESRFTFGLLELDDGIPFIAAIVGVFALAETLSLVQKRKVTNPHLPNFANVWNGAISMLKYRVTIVKAAIIGAVLGAIPGTGGPTSNFLAYLEAMRSSKEPETFGKGNVEGLIAPETANNATVGGTLIPTLTLGIPGNAITAILLGGLLIHGLIPGPQLFTINAPVTYAFFLSLFLGNIWIVIFGLGLAKYFARLSTISNNITVPIIVVFCMVGSYALRNSYFDVFLTVLFSLIGYFLVRNGYSMATFIIGMVLGPLAERNYYRALMISDGSHSIFFTRPISLILLLITLFSILWPYFKPIIKQWRAKKEKAPNQAG